MIRINLIGLFAWLLFIAAVIFGWPVWIALAWTAIEYPAVRWILVGFVGGCVVPLSIGWNLALRYRRDTMIDRAEQEYRKDKKTIRSQQ